MAEDIKKSFIAAFNKNSLLSSRNSATSITEGK